MRSVRTVVRTLIAGFLALAGPLLAAPAVLAHAQEVHQQSSRTDGASSHQLTISIDALNPSFATPGSTITVSGTITNHTGSPVTGAQVQVLSGAQYFYTRTDMDSYAAGHDLGYIFPQPLGTPAVVPGTLHNGATARWSATVSASAAGYSAFGVYPLVAQAEYADGTLSGAERTFLPFWPGTGSAVPLNTSWVWPLIDRPQQGPCTRTVATNTLATSMGTGGRLSTLLSVGQLWAIEDHLTWAVDPALLSDASVMAHSYKVDEESTCTGKKSLPASKATAAWLSSLRADTSGEPMFLTPYADTDVSALSHAGLDSDLRAAYQLGESQASQILSRSFGLSGHGSAYGGSPAVGWPADGMADANVLSSLASDGGISTVLLNSGALPSTAAPYDNALGATTTATAGSMRVLLADSELTSILGSASAASPAGTQFAAEQDFLAQTAMISAEVPNYQPARSLVIAPPRRWNPSATQAARLLSMTHSAPWLKTVDLASLSAAAGHLKAHKSLPVVKPPPAELGSTYLDEIRSVDSSLTVYKDLLLRPGPSVLRRLDAAALATESSAWRGAGAAAGWVALTKLADYLKYWEGKVQILTGTKLLLGGTSGPAPVSVQNAGDLPVQVKVQASVPQNSPLTADKIDKLITVLPGKTQTVTMTLHSSAIGTSQMQLQLVTKSGYPLDWTSEQLSVQATRYGRALLVLIGAALGVLVLTSMARWIRRQKDGRTNARSGGTG